MFIIKDYNLIEKARELGKNAHKEQRYGSYPYSSHLEHVYETLRRFGMEDNALLAAAWVHDTLEDTDMPYELLNASLGDEVANIVFAVTNERGKNRKERFAKTYPKIKENKKAIILKLADRIANVEACLRDKNYSLLNMYKKEYPEFKKQLHTAGENGLMWSFLDLISNKY